MITEFLIAKQRLLLECLWLASSYFRGGLSNKMDVGGLEMWGHINLRGTMLSREGPRDIGYIIDHIPRQ